MSNNEIPKNLKVLLALAEDVADGCALHETTVDLRSVREADLRAAIVALKGETPAPPAPPVPGLIHLYDQAKADTNAAKSDLKAKDAEANRFLSDARDVLKKVLGETWSPEWVLAGYTLPGSTAVPNRQDDRFASLAALAQYLTDHPTYQVPGGGVYPEVTSARAALLHTQISNCRAAVNGREAAQGQAKEARDAGRQALRALLIALVDDMTLRLGPSDPRWEAFGLNIPASPRAPEAAGDLSLSQAGPQQVLAEWRRGRRSNDNRILIQIVGTDTDWRLYGKSGNVSEELLRDLPTGATVKVKIIALNGSLEALDGPEGQIVVG